MTVWHLIGVILAFMVSGPIIFLSFRKKLKKQRERIELLKPFMDLLLEDYAHKIKERIRLKEILSVDSVSWDIDTIIKESYPEIPSFDEIHRCSCKLTVPELLEKINWTIEIGASACR